MKIWRYMPLSHYINMVARSKLYIPLTSRLSDPMEGVWFSETENFIMKDQIPYLNNKILLSEKTKELNEQDFRDYFNEFMGGFYRRIEMEGNGPVKQFLLNQISYEKIRNYFQEEGKDCPEEIRKIEILISDNMIHLGLIKNRTFVSSWSKGEEQNLALWKLFGHGDDTVAITTTVDKLRKAVEQNSDEIKSMGYRAEVVEVVYIDKIHRPSELTRQKMYEVYKMFQLGQVSSLAVKPKPYHYENEVRLIVFPLMDINAIEQDSIELDINVKGGRISDLLSGGGASFIDEIYLPPNLTKESPQYKAVEQLNDKFGIPNSKLKIDPIRMNNPFEKTK